MFIAGGRGRRSTSTDFGSVGDSIAANMDATSGVGRVHPALRAILNSVPNRMTCVLVVVKLAHCVKISRSPGYFAEGVDHSFQRLNAWSSWFVCVPAQCNAMPVLIQSSRGQSGLMNSKAVRISSHDALTPSPVDKVRTLSISSIDCQRSSSSCGIVGKRIQ